MSDSDVKYFWQHANQMTFLELQDVVDALQGCAAGDVDFEWESQNGLMELIANVARSEVKAIKQREEAERKPA